MKYLNHQATDESVRLAFLNASRDSNSCPQGLLNLAYNLVELAQVILESAEYAAKHEDEQDRQYVGTDDEVQSLLPHIKTFDQALQKAIDDVAGNVPMS
jgi:hypothetical protein